MTEIPEKYTIDNAKNDIQNLQDQNKYDFQEIKRLDSLIKEYDKRILQAINFNSQINKKIQTQISLLLDRIKYLEGTSPSGGESGLTITQANQLNEAYTHSQSYHVSKQEIESLNNIINTHSQSYHVSNEEIQLLETNVNTINNNLNNHTQSYHVSKREIQSLNTNVNTTNNNLINHTQSYHVSNEEIQLLNTDVNTINNNLKTHINSKHLSQADVENIVNRLNIEIQLQISSILDRIKHLEDNSSSTPDTPDTPDTPVAPDTPDTSIRVTGISLNNDTLTMNKIGGTYTLSYTITPSNATNKNVTWVTSEPTVASINNGIITANTNGSTVITIRTTDGGYTDSCTVTVNDTSYVEGDGDDTLYVPDIASYGIYNDGSNSESTTNGLNTLFADLNTNKKRNVQLPTGTYAINPDISLTPKSNLSLDLNNSTLKIDTNGKNGSTMVYLKEVENFTLKNGTIEGDRYDHDYSTYNQNTTSHEFNVGVKIDQGSRNINIDNVKFTKITGYGLATFQGTQYCNTRLDKTIMESGSYNDSGNKIVDATKIRYPQPVKITEHATYGYLQVGTLLNYQNYVFNSTRVVTVLIFDSNDTLLSKTTSNMYRPISVPPNANYCYLVFNQSNPLDYLEGDIYTLDVFHMKPPRDCNITNCVFDDNRCLGIAICGGWNFNIEGNTFKNTSKPTSDNSSPIYQHGKPGYAIDIEDGWESTQDLTINNNVFTNNGYGDIVSLAGDNTVITNNQFSGRVAMYSRNTNYVVQNNTIANGIAMFETEKDYGFTVDHNTYTDTTIKAKCYKPYDVDYYSFTNETITDCKMQLDTSITLKNSTISLDGTTGSRFTGSYDTCTITNFDGSDSNSDYNTGIKLNNCDVTKCNFFSSKDTIMTNNVFNTFRVRLDNGTLIFTGNDIQSNPKNTAMPIVQLNGGTTATIKDNTLSDSVTVDLYTNPAGITVITE